MIEVPVGDDERTIVVSRRGWVIPEADLGGRALGADLDALVPFVPPNDGPHGVNIDAAFLEANAGAAWLSEENGIPVIDRIDGTDRCLNIAVPLILRRSYISCPTRIQSDAWGYIGTVDDAPAVNIAGRTAEGVIIEHNTITCSGFDANICGRNVRVGSSGAIIRFNDLSHARGAVGLYNDTAFVFNHLHDFSFGFDPTRANSETDFVTHNNSVNNLGYRNVTVAGNFIDATYGRVSLSPEENLYTFFPQMYGDDGVVEVGDPINGFAFTNYLINGDGVGARYERNYVRNAGRPFRCNQSAAHAAGVCAEDISFNVFVDLRIEQFNSVPPFEDADGAGVLEGRCNFRQIGDTLSPLVLPNEAPQGSCLEQLEFSEGHLVDFLSDVAALGTADR
jgi:hypothetical protein